MKTNKKNVTKLGGISFETKRSGYRGSVNLNGVRYRTKYFATELAAKRALNKLIRTIQVSA
jgi:hypothetical protein